jgi:hypothetical protein
MAASLPYGPNSPAIRQFLVQLAGLGAIDRARVATRYDALSGSRGWSDAERHLAEAITRADREGFRDALSGPLLQLVRRPEAAPVSDASTEEEAMAALDPVAEPALAALLALVVDDLLDARTRDTLHQPFAGVLDAPTSTRQAPDGPR